MANTSKTGLLASVRIPIDIEGTPRKYNPELRPIARPAPVVLRPFAGIYNPFPYGCSVLCNHPADLEARDVLKRAKDTWATEGKNEELNFNDKFGRPSFMNAPVPTDDWVPEELFRKYTETDSRPATPAPTLASVATKTSHRRCLTPDPSAKEKTLLILDLRRSHSQETLSWRGMVAPAPLLPPPAPTPRWKAQQQLQYQNARMVAMQHRRQASPSPQRCRSRRSNKSAEQTTASVAAPETPAPPVPIIITEESADLSPDSGTRSGLRRRGRRSKKLRDGAQSPEKEFKCLDEPGETQVSTLEDDVNTSTNEIYSGEKTNEVDDVIIEPVTSQLSHDEPEPHQSFLHVSILQQLQRQLDWQVVEAEFELKRHTALEEAMKAPRLRPGCSEIRQLAVDLDLTPSRPELWLSVPRSFSRRSARFELPIDTRQLTVMTPIQYCQLHVRVSTARKLLYNGIFNKHREDSGMENEPRFIRAKSIPQALADVMGQQIIPEHLDILSNLLAIEWNNETLDFRTFCGLSAVCERIIGAKRGLLKSLKLDPRAEVEQADFQTLGRRIKIVKDSNSTIPELLTSLNNA